MTIPVWWFTSNAGVAARGYWDQSLTEALLDGSLWPPGPRHAFEHRPPAPDEGAVVVVPARMEDGHATAVADVVGKLPWCLLILTSDEEGGFPWRNIEHPRLRTWVMSPRPDRHAGIHRGLGSGFRPDTRRLLAGYQAEADERPLDWFFAGQVTHERREACAAALLRLERGELHATKVFGGGLDYETYLRKMASARLAPCPSGPVSPDSFRVFEALEAGCLPLADATAPNGVTDYWSAVCDGWPPFPLVADWRHLPDLVAECLAGWPGNANRAFAWWQRHKRALARALAADVEALSSVAPAPVCPVTVLVPTSPVPSHPDTAITEATLTSIRERLPLAEIVLMIDGVRLEQSDRRPAYDRYLHRLLWLTNHRYGGVIPLVHDVHQHQARLARDALDWVTTPFILYVEHDCPLVGEVDWAACLELLATDADLIRFHHEAQVLDEHRYLMPDGDTTVNGVRYVRCAQWSQRPHLARVDYYRRVLHGAFDAMERAMIEDRVHGLVASAWQDRGDAGWSEHRLWMYHEPDAIGSIKRSTHLDARAGDPKWVTG